MSEDIIDGAAPAGAVERPTFLTVLCILTWIGSGLGAILVWTGDGASATPMWYKSAILLANVATGYAAWEMWNLKKQGLMIYTAGEVLALILPWILVYAILPPFLANMMSGLLMITSLFPIAFLVMYWINARHLK
ncbi:MAG: hypothetical protein MK078_15015 [Crocinitomicaceae bacterium]|nr:hypothetical protein [Crocinitomicaceae bacterium]